ncbi:glycosyltransferase family 39 protein [Fulvivirga ligni]|uniref:glycosyltransferase family 39 protein n=1 Tax=Fulvivirga ligni TaxID=2904246 RepID=UPI001F1DB838|nr:glycosyltransferase family 39 protein [Fulvivirga ligni]UII20773.1 glycosyltransferase family 39 protein [Fulvivirga ligni]
MADLKNNSIKQYYQAHPLRTILLAALFLRLLAAFFSEGYAFHDDHFCVTRVAQSWAQGIPHWVNMDHPPMHSMPYAGINAIIIWIVEHLGITDSIAKTTILRIFHAFYSLLTVYFAYKITNLISNKKNAAKVGWILTILWFMPYLSVKFLAELVCVPPLLAGFYLILREKAESKKLLPYLCAGALFGLAFTFRMHSVLFAGGLGIILLFRKKWLESVVFTAGFLIITFILIAIPDMIFFDYPYQYIVGYFTYNSENAYNYVTGGPFKFLLTTFGFLVPPVSVFLIWGYIKGRKIEPMMYLGILIFFIVHSIFPNKQERFILPMYPFLIIIGTIGWTNFVEHSKFWIKHPKLHNGLWNFFWGINIIATLAMALTFTKRDRIEPLHYLSKKTDVTSVIVESERGGVKQVPVYYLGTNCVDYDELHAGLLGLEEFEANQKYLDPNFKVVFDFGADKSPERLQFEMDSVQKQPNYIIFKGENNFDQRKQRVNALFPGKKLTLEKEINPSHFDQLLHILNPRVHRNDVARVYKID